MQKIAYSTLAIAVPVVLQGCSEDDEQTAPEVPEVDCSTLAETECKAIENAQCNWNTSVQESKNCSRAEVDVSSAGNDSLECDEQFGGIVSQQCKPVQVCSAYDLITNGQFPNLGRNNGTVSWSEVNTALDENLDNFIKVYFSNASTSTFDIVGAGADNPDDLCVGYIFQSIGPLSDTLTMWPTPDTSDTTTDTFTCGGADTTVAGSFAAASSFNPSEPIPVTNSFGNNVVYDADFYDACNEDTLCGMQTDGTCQVIQDFCAQFDATNCPIAYSKDNVRFIQGQVAGVPVELISDALVCEYIANVGDFIPDADGNDTDETYAAPFGCRTVQNLELPTCEGSPFPSNNKQPAVNPLDPDGESEGILIEDMCNLWLADDKDWNAENSPRARPIYECVDGQIDVSALPELSCLTPWTAEPSNQVPRESSEGRACMQSGDATSVPDFDKQCALPRNFTCDIATDDNGAELEECSIGFQQNNSNVCVYDNGNRDFCSSTSPTGDEDVDGVRGPDEGTE